ncbi:hypothetical protein F5884DRAFT_788658 [Xylogone sp. PMI_703]|nr:hypothetical protein F5884DRAFT_788658 [Xylogone sp. PMI_703]
MTSQPLPLSGGFPYIYRFAASGLEPLACSSPTLAWLARRITCDAYSGHLRPWHLTDAYRLRVEDDYTFDGDVDEDSLYSGASSGLAGFKRFLRLARSRQGLLPPWWNPTKQHMCERLGMDSSQWHSLRHAVEKSDIIEHYGDPRFPMQLRMFAEAVP